MGYAHSRHCHSPARRGGEWQPRASPGHGSGATSGHRSWSASEGRWAGWEEATSRAVTQQLGGTGQRGRTPPLHVRKPATPSPSGSGVPWFGENGEARQDLDMCPRSPESPGRREIPSGGRGGAQTGAPLAAVAPSVPVGGGHHVSTPFPPELPPPCSRPPHPVPPTAPQVLSGPQTCGAATPLPSSGPGASLSGAPHPVFGEGQPPLLWPLGQA